MDQTARSDDLSLTIQELSNTYEELSLLYKVSELFSFLSIDEICSRIADEAAKTIGVRTVAVLFYDETTGAFYTKTSRGKWDKRRKFTRDSAIIGKAVESRKPLAFCRLRETEYRDDFPDLVSIMVCPLLGKVKILGAIVVADKEEDEEFFSNDSKLLMTIATQAGLAIENAFLYSELESLLLGAIRSLVKALEATSCWTAGHTERVTAYALSIGKVMGLDSDMMEKLKISALLHDIGKIATPSEVLNKVGALDDHEWMEMKKHPEVGAEILQELREFTDIIMAIKYHHEHWDGQKGIFGLKHEEIPMLARILSVADAFDAMTSDRPYRMRKSRESAVDEIVRCSGTQFAPAVVEAFSSWVKSVSLPHLET